MYGKIVVIPIKIIETSVARRSSTRNGACWIWAIRKGTKILRLYYQQLHLMP
jgi:hypothetical protein